MREKESQDHEQSMTYEKPVNEMSQAKAEELENLREENEDLSR